MIMNITYHLIVGGLIILGVIFVLAALQMILWWLSQ